MNMLEKIRQLVKKEADEDDWKYHIVPVANYAKKLAKLLKVDEEITELAALLHDIGRLKFGGEDHDITGVPEAEKILKQHGYSQEIIDEVKHCVESHRGSKTFHQRQSLLKLLLTQMPWLILMFCQFFSIGVARKVVLKKHLSG